jgi:hypothetical protein
MILQTNWVYKNFVFICFLLLVLFIAFFLSCKIKIITNYFLKEFIGGTNIEDTNIEGVTFTTNPVFKNKSSPTFTPINNYYINSKITQDFDPDSVITTFS